MARKGKIKKAGGKNILYVMATEAEYGRHLQARFDPLICHVGPVEAAINVSNRLTAGEKIDLVVSLGSAGSRTLEQAQIYQIAAASYRDMDASPLGFGKGETPFLDLPATLDLPIRLAGIPLATIATGASIVSGDAYEGIEADMVDMETYAILRACMAANLPLIGLRGISDGAHPVEELSDWTHYLDVIDERMAVTVDALEAQVADGLIAG